MSPLNGESIQPPQEEIIMGYKRIVLIPEIRQMMFVAGETGEPSSETTTLIEQIVHEQVIEMVILSFPQEMFPELTPGSSNDLLLLLLAVALVQ